MAKNQAKNASAAAPKANGKSINRKRKNSFERKCLPKALKTLLAGSDHVTYRAYLQAWQESRKRPSGGNAPVKG